MKTRAISLIICVVSLTMFSVTSCIKSDDICATDNTVRFVAGVSTMAPIESTNAGLVTSGTINGIQILQGAYGASPKFNLGGTIGAVASVASLDGTGVLNCSPTLSINTDGSTANYLAFYPLGTLAFGTGSTPATVTYTIDGETDIIAANRVSKTYSASDNTVNLAFKHQLARLRLRCIARNDYSQMLYQSITEAKIIVPKTAVMNIPDNGVITTNGKFSDPIAESDYTELNFGTCDISQTGEYATKNLMILPNAAFDSADVIRNMEIKLKFAGFPEIAAQAYSLNHLSLIAGKTTTITVQVSGTEPDPELTITWEIEDWNEVGDSGIIDNSESSELVLLGDANSYILNPAQTGAPDRVFAFPIDRINRFWAGRTPDLSLGDSDTWTAELLWQDTPTSDFIRFVDPADVTYNSRSLTQLGVGPDQRIYVTTKAGYEGNALVCLKNSDGQILWSWHLWVTDYNPDYTAAPVSGKYVYPVTGGNVHRYAGEIWTSGTYANKYIMDRNLGARNTEQTFVGALYYQWGRKDPLPLYVDNDGNNLMYDINGIEIPYTGAYSGPTEVLFEAANKTIGESVLAPTTFYAQDISTDSWCSEHDYAPDPDFVGFEGEGYMLEIVGFNYWHNENQGFDTKSLYDPCPPGWKIPSYKPFEDFEKNDTNHNLSTVGDAVRDPKLDPEYNGMSGIRYWPQGSTVAGEIYYPMLGSRSIKSGNLIIDKCYIRTSVLERGIFESGVYDPIVGLSWVNYDYTGNSLGASMSFEAGDYGVFKNNYHMETEAPYDREYEYGDSRVGISEATPVRCVQE